MGPTRLAGRQGAFQPITPGQFRMKTQIQITSPENSKSTRKYWCSAIRFALFIPLLFASSFSMAGGGPSISFSTLGKLMDYTEGDGAKILDSSVTVAQQGLEPISGATIEISGAPTGLGEHVLAFVDQNGITGALSNNSETLTLSASSSVAANTWEQALQSITYENTSDDPVAEVGFGWQLTDDSNGPGISDQFSVPITSVNDPPTVSSPASSTVLENSPAGTFVQNVSASDVDDTFLAYSITNGDPNGFFFIDSIGDITLTTAGAVEVNQDNLVTTTYTLEITVSDDETPTPASTTATLDVTFEAVNDPPTLFGSSIFVDEGATLTLTSSEIVVSDADDNLTDVSIAISNLSSNLSIQIAGSPVTSFTAQQLTDGDVKLVHDGSEAATALFDLTVEDGNEDSSTPTAETLFATVTPINDPPVITDASSTLAYTEEDPAAIIDATLTISDAENDQLQSATVTISSGYEPSEDACSSMALSYQEL